MLRLEHRSGLESLATVTALLQQTRRMHPTWGLYEAADLQWWWAQGARRTDEVPQLFWIDEDGTPDAAVITTAWRNHVQFDPLVPVDASSDRVAEIVGTGLDHAESLGFDNLALEVDGADEVLIGTLTSAGFVDEGEAMVEAWLGAAARPAVSPLADGYRLASRADDPTGAHHMLSEERVTPDPEARLRQTSLYRVDLDLVVHDASGAVASYGLFWFDPTSRTGLVEPMRTEDDHQRRGLARHVLTAGLDRLARAGAERIKICYEVDNHPASGHLYLSTGFIPDRRTRSFTRDRRP